MRLRGQLISFRADASPRLGTGHVMRCLTLADELRRRGATCQFICRGRPGDFIHEIAGRGYPAHSLMSPEEDIAADPEARDSPQEADEIADAGETNAILSAFPSSVIVVDHYSLGERWETAVRYGGRHVVAIDDLANRTHSCDVLVDQNLGRSEDHYRSLVPRHCQILVGPRYASLRSEFREWRDYSLRRRAAAHLRHLFISMGGIDHSNATGLVLVALQHSSLPADCRITIALGQGAPWADQVQELASGLPWATDVIVNTNCIAEIMANSDLAVGAAGGTAWERCCLGLPALIVIVAENQRFGANALVRANAAYRLGDPDSLTERLPQAIERLRRAGALAEMSLASSRLVDGLGAERVGRHIGDLLEHS